MSSRELLRVAIRTLAPPVVIVYIFYKFYLEIKDKPFFKNVVMTWRKLFNRLSGNASPDELKQEEN